MSYITLVKNIKADGAPRAKCADVLNRLERDELAELIDQNPDLEFI